MPLDENDILLIKSMFHNHLSNGHDLEVLWLLYLLLETGNLNDDNSIIDSILESTNELAQIVLLQKGYLTAPSISQLCNTANSWILLYELYANDHLTEDVFKARLHINKNLDMYKQLKRRGIHFCA